MQVIHRMGRKLVASVVAVLFVSLQVLPQGFAKQLPVEAQTQSQVPEQSPVSIPSSVIQESNPPTSIDFLVGSESPLSIPGPIVLPHVPPDVPPVSMPEPESQFEYPTQVPVEPIDPKFLEPDWVEKPEVDPIPIDIPQPEFELTPAPEPQSIIEPQFFFSPISKKFLAQIAAMRSLMDSFNITDEEKEQVFKDIKLISIEKKDFSICGGWGETCVLPAFVTGYQVVLELYGNTYEFRAGKLDPAKQAAISAINHLMENGTPKNPFSKHLVYPELSQIRIGSIMIRIYFKDGFVNRTLYDIDLKVQWNHKRSVTWRYTVDGKANEVTGRKLYGPNRLGRLTYLIDYDKGERVRPKRPFPHFHPDLIRYPKKLELKAPKHGFQLSMTHQEKTKTVNR